MTRNPAPLKVIGLGLGRTGTVSLCSALQILGFGPCHHPAQLPVELAQWDKFAKATKDPSPEFLDEIYSGYVSALDNTAAILAEPLYKAYPNAKFILTVRDPTKWVQSMKKTMIKNIEEYTDREVKVASGTATDAERVLFEQQRELGMIDWADAYHKGYHQCRLLTDPEGELFRHNQYIKQLIPPEKLLVFDVSQGWKPLCEFLGVPEPKEPFPRVNDSAEFEKRSTDWWDQLTDRDSAQARVLRLNQQKLNLQPVSEMLIQA